MKLTNLALAVAVLVASFPAAAEPPQPARPQPARPGVIQPIGERPTKLTVANVITTPGNSRAFDAFLTDTSGKPVDNKKIKVLVQSTPDGPFLATDITVGTGITGVDGHALIPWTCPDLAQGAYLVWGIFEGDPTALATKSTSNLSIMKAGMQIGLDNDVALSATNNGTAYSFTMILSRATDQKTIDRTVTVTINGKAQQVTTKSGHAQIPFTPQDAKTWDVKVQFNGDDHTLAAAAERKYTHP